MLNKLSRQVQKKKKKNVYLSNHSLNHSLNNFFYSSSSSSSQVSVNYNCCTMLALSLKRCACETDFSLYLLKVSPIHYSLFFYLLLPFSYISVDIKEFPFLYFSIFARQIFFERKFFSEKARPCANRWIN